jgi:ACR3 family arsenite efflux pump ArsB
MIWFLIYYVFAGMFSVGYVPVNPLDSLKTRIIVDILLFVFGFLIFPLILGSAFRVWLLKKK